MTDRQMTVTLGPLSTISAGKGKAQPVAAVAKDRSAEAGFPGKAVFTTPVVLPKSGRFKACELTIKASAPGSLKIGGKAVGRFTGGKTKKFAIDAKPFEKGKDFVIEELAFADFKQVDIVVEVAAPKAKNAKLALTAEMDYQIPVESAADYLNYVMTQA